MGGATLASTLKLLRVTISIHAPRGGCDYILRHLDIYELHFNPRTPWGVRLCRSQSDRIAVYFNPRTPWGVRPPLYRLRCPAPSDFNPRTPWGVRHTLDDPFQRTVIFQSTHPVGGATGIIYQFIIKLVFQSTHPVGGATLGPSSFSPSTSAFQSTHPVGGATNPIAVNHNGLKISIHAPRGGCDRGAHSQGRPRLHFNPRTPWGVRPGDGRTGAGAGDFNPRTPWGVRPPPA